MRWCFFGFQADGLYRSGILNLLGELAMASRQGEDDAIGMDGLDEDDHSWRIRKRLRSAGSGDDEREKCRFVVVRFEGVSGVKAMDPLKLTKILKNQVGAVNNAKVLDDGNLLIGCISEEQVVKAMKLHEVGKAKVAKVARVGSEGSKGVISGVPVSVQMTDLFRNLKEKCGAVQSAVRLTRGLEKKDTESILIQFSSKEVPTEVFVGFLRYRVREFVHKPLRCFKCQKFGHAARACSGTQTCARCGGAHEYGNCGVGVEPKCCNCGGAHSAAYWGCAVMKRESEIHNMKVKNKLSYAEAVKRVDQTNGAVGTETAAVDRGAERVAVKAVELGWKEKLDLVVFITGVLSATAEVKWKSTTEKIRVITKVAVEHLGMVGLTWEVVRERLLGLAVSQEGAD